MPFVTPKNDSVGEVLVEQQGLASVPIILHPTGLASYRISLLTHVSHSVLWQN